MTKSIAVITNSLSGLSKFRKEVIVALADEGYSVHIISEPDENGKEGFKDLGVNHIFVNLERKGVNPISDLRLLSSYIKQLRKIKPLCVLTYTIKPNIYGGIACSLLGIPQFANVTGLGDSIETPGLLQKLTLKLYKFGLRKTNVIFFQNKFNLDYFISQGIKGEKTVLLPGSGVNLGKFNYIEYPVHNTVEFVYAGRLSTQKGFGEYIEAAQMLKKEYGDRVVFHVCGKCYDGFGKTVEELHSHNIINYHGYANLIELYKQIDCNVMPSWHEGMSNVCLEAAAMGRPTVTTNVPGCLETVDDGITGILVEPKNAHSLACGQRKIIEMNREERMKMGLLGRQKMEKMFDRKIVVQKYLDEIQKIK